MAFASRWQFFTPENPSELIELYSELGMKLKSNKIKALAAFSPGSSSFKSGLTEDQIGTSDSDECPDVFNHFEYQVGSIVSTTP